MHDHRSPPDADQPRDLLYQPQITGLRTTKQIVGANASALGGSDMRTRNFANVAEATTNRRHRRRSEEHTSELQSQMRITYAVFRLKKKKKIQQNTKQQQVR